MQASRRQLESLQSQLSQSEQRARELTARDSDLTEALGVKDAQLGVLRVRLEEADKSLESKNKTITAIEAEKER